MIPRGLSDWAVVQRGGGPLEAVEHMNEGCTSPKSQVNDRSNVAIQKECVPPATGIGKPHKNLRKWATQLNINFCEFLISRGNKEPMTSHPSPLYSFQRVLCLNTGLFLTKYVIPALLILIVSTMVLIRAWLTSKFTRILHINNCFFQPDPSVFPRQPLSSMAPAFQNVDKSSPLLPRTSHGCPFLSV